jgi:hypothetical protein
MYGVHLAHKVGDLVRINNSRRDPIISSAMLQRGSLGVVVERPEDTQKSLFILVYIFKTQRLRWLVPSEIDIISNIEE